jgi:hypothetical protein
MVDMDKADLPPGLVMWPADTAQSNRLCVLISDIHCTDCTVGNQTASETDWKLFFEQLEFAIGNPGDKAQMPADSAVQMDMQADAQVNELLLILNGDIIDVIRSSKWVEADVYPWHRDDPRFPEIVLAIMRDIVAIHAHKRPDTGELPYSGFFYWMRMCMTKLRARDVKVTVIPIVGNHDKELQVVPEARRMFYEECLGLAAADISDHYRTWVAAQLGTAPDDPYPCLPFYFADAGFRMLATHGQWRDADNARATSRWCPRNGWTPQQWQLEQYKAFTDPCFGDTVAAGMLSRFIWSTGRTIDKAMPGARRICNLLDEMDLYRPSVAAVVRLLHESRLLARQQPQARSLHNQVLKCFHESMKAWLADPVTWRSACGSTRLGLLLLFCLSPLRWYWIDVVLMRLMAKVQEPEASIATATVLRMPAFQPAYRALGLRLHVEGHTHIALEADVQFRQPRTGRNNYTYVNLGAWRDRILPKCNRGHRRRGIGRALFIFDLNRFAQQSPHDAFRFYARDMTSWGDRLDSW